MRLYPAEKAHNPYTGKLEKQGHEYGGPMQAKAIADDLKVHLVANNILRVRKAEELEVARQHAQLPLVVLFARERKESSIVYRSLSLFFRQRLIFVEVGTGLGEVLDEFDVDPEEVPVLFVVNRAGEQVRWRLGNDGKPVLPGC